jgi:hypothetical protein
MGGVAVLALVAMLLLALSSCAITSADGAASSGPTAGAATSPGAQGTPTSAGTQAPSATATHAPTEPPRSTPTKTATPKPPVPSVHAVAHTTTLYGGQTGPVTASCPQGEFALGGGWSAPSQHAHVFAARLISGATWSVSVQPLDHASSTVVTAYAECLRDAPGAVVTPRTATVSVPAFARGSAAPKCTGVGEVAVGWGFSFDSSTGQWVESASPNKGFWAVGVKNDSAQGHSAYVYVQCLSHAVVTDVVVASSPPSNVLTGATASDQVSCDGGYTVAGGGYAVDRTAYVSDEAGTLYSLHATATGWQGSVYAVTDLQFKVTAQCLRFL